MPETHSGAAVSGLVGCTGKARGIARIVMPENISTTMLDTDSVLVCPVTMPEYVPLMRQANAIVTDQGGILSHAAIVARELNKPCIVSTGNATKMLREGQWVTVDADRGIVTW